MDPRDKGRVLEQLARIIRRVENRGDPPAGAVATGWAPIDEALCDRGQDPPLVGLRVGSVHEFIGPAGGDRGDPRTAASVAGSPICLLAHLARRAAAMDGGFVITRDPLCELVPIVNASMPDRTIIEWDKDDIDAMGLLKVDCLGLGMLTCIRKCFELVAGAGGWGPGKRIQESTVGGPKAISPVFLQPPPPGPQSPAPPPLSLATIPPEDP
ncbi:MAG: hypothetical protein PHU85_13085, partial [Phycisphaerae bacterium]|nr:hypothetical protein [Phycisphaerae bacterium]